MLGCVRTTLTMDDALMQQVKELAARSHRTMSEVIEDAVRVLLARQVPRDSTAELVLPTFGGSGLRPGVDLDDKESLAALLDESA